MPSEEAVMQAGKDVLRYHSRRTKPPGRSRMSRGDYAFSLLFCVISGIGIQVVRKDPQLNELVMVSLLFAVCLITLVIRDFRLYGSPTTVRQLEQEARKYRRAIHFLTHSMEPSAIGPLAEALWLPGITKYVPYTLIRLLPLMQPEDSNLLNAKQHACLLRVLTEPDLTSAELQQTVVNALAKMGNAQALPVLEQLVGGAWCAADSPELRTDAHAALMELQERIHPGYIGRTLLRASETPADSPALLLRHASRKPETSPQELLRPEKSVTNQSEG